MPKVDLTITISAVIAICAIISPILTTWINNHYRLKEKKIDAECAKEKEKFFYKRGVYEDYLKWTASCISSATGTSLSEYGQAYALALVYFPNNLCPDLIQIDKLIALHRWQEARDVFNALAPKIRAKLQKL